MTELTPVETESPAGGYGKTISHLIIGLKTAKGTKQLKLDPTIYESLQKERVEVRTEMDFFSSSSCRLRERERETLLVALSRSAT